MGSSPAPVSKAHRHLSSEVNLTRDGSVIGSIEDAAHFPQSL